jgi:hypothetical protein
VKWIELEGDSSAAENYLRHAFGDKLEGTIDAMRHLVAAYFHDDLDRSKTAYHLHEQFRPTVHAGISGWGQKGLLDLNLIRRLAEDHVHA